MLADKRWRTPAGPSCSPDMATHDGALRWAGQAPRRPQRGAQAGSHLFFDGLLSGGLLILTRMLNYIWLAMLLAGVAVAGVTGRVSEAVEAAIRAADRPG